MSVAITIRDVPKHTRDQLAAQAAQSGKSLQEYLRGLLIDTAAQRTSQDVIARVRARVSAAGAMVPAEATLAARDVERR